MILWPGNGLLSTSLVWSSDSHGTAIGGSAILGWARSVCAPSNDGKRRSSAALSRFISFAEAVPAIGESIFSVGRHRRLDPVALALRARLEIGDHLLVCVDLL